VNDVVSFRPVGCSDGLEMIKYYLDVIGFAQSIVNVPEFIAIDLNFPTSCKDKDIVNLLF